MQARIVSIVGGVITLVIGLVLSGVIISAATAAGISGQVYNCRDSSSDVVGTATTEEGCKSVTGADATKTVLKDKATITSFSGAQSINDLVPLVYFTVIVMVAVGMIGVGLGGFAGRGPMG
jgi:hypothetical protein